MCGALWKLIAEKRELLIVVNADVCRYGFVLWVFAAYAALSSFRLSSIASSGVNVKLPSFSALISSSILPSRV
jgi:hypothetical protein